jgi:hypothetical protein
LTADELSSSKPMWRDADDGGHADGHAIRIGPHWE